MWMELAIKGDSQIQKVWYGNWPKITVPYIEGRVLGLAAMYELLFVVFGYIPILKQEDLLWYILLIIKRLVPKNSANSRSTYIRDILLEYWIS